jgi:type IV pilus assembly protein PilA
VANYTSQGSYVAAADLGTALSSDGYTAPGDANYGTDGIKPAITYVANDGGFCIQATSVTGKTFAASDTTGVAEGTCSAAGIWTAPAAP